MASLIIAYLDDLGHSLYVGSRLKNRILYEVEDHLLQSVQYHQEQGLSVEEAERRAIASFGSPRLVAQQFVLDLAGSSASMVSKVMFLAVIGLQLISQLGYHFLPEADHPRHIMMNASLAGMINLYSLAFQVALAASLFALWYLRPSSSGVEMSQRKIQNGVGALVLALIALVVAASASIVFVFQVSCSPLVLLQTSIASSEILLILVGSIFVLQATMRFVALQAIS